MDVKKFIAFSCTHCPIHDKKAEAWLHEQITDYRPDVIVCLGDLHEADSASKWPSDYTWTLEDEYKSANDYLRRIRETTSSRDCDLVFLPGNHDDNIQAIGRIPSKIRSLVDYRDHETEFSEGHWQQPCEYIFDRKKGVYRIGQVSFFHGWKTGKGADESQGLILGNPYGLSISGHSHSPIPVTQSMKGTTKLPYWFANAGTLRDIDNVPYMQRKDRSGWGQAVVVGEAAVLKSARNYKAWSAETRIFKMYGD